jgi:hypothetical protein
LKAHVAILETKQATLTCPTDQIQPGAKQCMWENEVGDKTKSDWTPPCKKHGADVIKRYCAYHQKLARNRSNSKSMTRSRKPGSKEK